MGQYDVQEKALDQNKSSNNQQTRTVQLRYNNMEDIIQRAKINPNIMRQNDAMVLQRKIGNSGTMQLLKYQGKIQDDVFIQMRKNNAIQRVEMSENKTGMPGDLKAGVENLSGIDMSDVRVHYNSDKPEKVGALAYTQGTEIHVAPGQEKHLTHEAWHVVQQKQHRVRATTQLKGIAINDEPALEREADTAKSSIMQMKTSVLSSKKVEQPVLQCQLDDDFEHGGEATKEEKEACKTFAIKVSQYVDNAYNDLLSGNITTWKGIKVSNFMKSVFNDYPMAHIDAANAIEERVYDLMNKGRMNLPWTPQYAKDMGGASKPDIVINLSDVKEALIDITSDRGHILRKAGGWTTSKKYVYVAEAYFPSITKNDIPNIKKAMQKGGIDVSLAQNLKKQADDLREKQMEEKEEEVRKMREVLKNYFSFRKFALNDIRFSRIDSESKRITEANKLLRAHGISVKGMRTVKGRRKQSEETKKRLRAKARKAKEEKRRQSMDTESMDTE